MSLPVQSNSTYDLFIRYKSQPESVSHYTIEVKPHWWQTTAFRTIAGGVILLLLLLFPFFFYQQRKKQQLLKKELEKKQYILELKSVYAQLNPHFIFNALSSIQGLMNNNQLPEANHYLTEFAGLLRTTLQQNEKDLVPVSIEIKTLESYMQLEQLRFRFHYQVTTAPSLNTNDVEIPSLLLQPLVENAIRHGVSYLQENGQVQISFDKQQNNLLVTIKDNGAGFQTGAPTTGYGLRLTKERIALFNENNQLQRIYLDINSNAKGSTVLLQFENWL